MARQGFPPYFRHALFVVCRYLPRPTVFSASSSISLPGSAPDVVIRRIGIFAAKKRYVSRARTRTMKTLYYTEHFFIDMARRCAWWASWGHEQCLRHTVGIKFRNQYRMASLFCVQWAVTFRNQEALNGCLYGSHQMFRGIPCKLNSETLLSSPRNVTSSGGHPRGILISCVTYAPAHQTILARRVAPTTALVAIETIIEGPRLQTGARQTAVGPAVALAPAVPAETA